MDASCADGDSATKNVRKDKMENAAGCAHACRGESQMFAFGMDGHCSDGKCNCYCQMNTENFQCKTQKTEHNYKLYAFKGMMC